MTSNRAHSNEKEVVSGAGIESSSSNLHSFVLFWLSFVFLVGILTQIFLFDGVSKDKERFQKVFCLRKSYIAASFFTTVLARKKAARLKPNFFSEAETKSNSHKTKFAYF